MFELRRMTETDLPQVLEWRNRLDVRSNMYTSHVISPEEHRKWFASASADASKVLLMCVDSDHVPVGVVTFSEISTSSRTAVWAFYSGDTSRRGIGSVMEQLALDYAFGELGLEKLCCEVLSFNMPVVEFHRKHGFRLEGVLRSHYERDGKRHDVYRLAIFRRAWLEQVRPVMEAARGGRGGRFKTGMSHREDVVVTAEEIASFARLSGDLNPVHLDDGAARAAGFPGRIAHGMLVASAFSRVLGQTFPGAGTIYISQALQFHKPVFPGQALQVELKIISVIGSRAIISTSVTGPDGVTYITGEAEVLLPKGD